MPTPNATAPEFRGHESALFQVPSKSQPGKFHQVTISLTGEVSCTCRGFAAVKGGLRSEPPSIITLDGCGLDLSRCCIHLKELVRELSATQRQLALKAGEARK